jgi:heparan-alpha-glucosaminide N-acetyltransferase
MSPDPAIARQPTTSARVLSIDLLRGFDVLLMLFVNEVAGVPQAPAFLKHTPSDADGMTITDVVFPAFLFIVGMALPFALGGRLRRGESRGRVLRHVLMRTTALLAMGVLMLGAEHAASDGLLSPELWNLLMTIGVVLAWAQPAPGAGPWRARGRALAVALLVALVLVYRADGGRGLIQIRPHWWGILGLIGWAYLVAASIYLLAGERPALLAGGIALLYCLYLADEAGQAGWLVSVRSFVNVGRNLGAHAAVTLSGALLGLLLVRDRREDRAPASLIPSALGYAAALGSAGLLLHTLAAVHPAFWINKVMATAPWCLISSALTCAAWVGVYALADVYGFRRWPKAIGVAGENALLAYFAAPFLLSAFALTAGLLGRANGYDELAQPVWLGLLRSALFAWLVVFLCGLTRRVGIRLQL